MTRRHWKEIALALGRVRRRLDAHAARARSDKMFLAHRDRALGVDLAARVLCRVLRRQSQKFDGRQFMRAYVSASK